MFKMCWRVGRFTRVAVQIFVALIVVVVFGPANLRAQVSETVVRIGARGDAPPMSYWDEESGKFRGYSIDICDRVFQRYSQTLGSGVKFEYVEVNAFDRFKRLDSGDIKAICGATTVTVARMKKYNFSFFTFLSGASVMTRVSRTKGLPAARDALPKEDVRVAVVSETTTKDRMEELLGTTVSIVPKKTHFEALAALENEEVDYYVGDRVILQRVLAQKGTGKPIRVGSRFLTYEPYAIAIAAKERGLLLAANETISELYRSGDIKTLFAGHFSDSAKSRMLDNMYQIFSIPAGSPDGTFPTSE